MRKFFISLLAALLAVGTVSAQQLPSPRYKSVMLQNNIATSTASPDQFFAENGGPIDRLGGRVFVGDATKNAGTNSGVQPDWLTTYLISKGRTFGFQQVTQLAALTREQPYAANAILGAGQTKYLGIPGNTIGVLGVGIANYNAEARGAWGGYFEAFKDASSAGNAIAAELDIMNFDSVVNIDAFTQDPEMTVGLQIASAGEFLSANAASAAINIRNNGNSFVKGLVFGNNSITGANGSTGVATAIEMATGHTLDWYSSAGNRAWAIYAAPGANQDFNFVPTGTGSLSVPRIKETVGNAWASYTPTVTAISGTFTSVSATGRYREIGKSVEYTAQISITTNGTAASGINMSLPVAIGGGVGFSFACDERATSGVLCRATGTTGSSNVQIFRYDNTYLGGNGAVVVVSGTYQKA